MVRRYAPAQYLWFPPKASAVAPLISIFCSNKLRQIHAGDARKAVGMLDSRFYRFPPRHNAARLGAFQTNEPRQSSSVDIRNGDSAALLQKVRKRALRSPAARQHCAVANNETRGVNLSRLHVVTVCAGITDMRIRESYDLTTVGRVSQDFLITRHRGIEYHLADSLAFGTDRGAAENGAIL